MAATLTTDGELTFISFPIEKTETTPDGDIYVYGKATDGSVDSDEQIVDTDFSSKAIANWLTSGANVRVQHNAQRDPAGVGVEVSTGPEGDTWVKSLVVEPIAKRLVEKGALRAYSVGIARPKIVRDSVARGGRIVDGEIVEISLVDRPANKNCGIQLVKSDKDGNAEFTGKLFGDSDLLTKSESSDEVKLPASATFSPADLAKLLEHRAVAEKRQMDPSVGGGVDRDKIPAKDFAGRDRSFPIVTPGDVSDAASSIGRAGSSNYSSDKLKSNIIRIARRKGDAFVAELPESWKKDLGMKKSDDKVDVEKANDGVVDDSDVDIDATKADAPVDSDDDDGNEAKPDTTKADAKGMKTCKGCGKGYDADSKLRKCEKCGAKLPLAKGEDEADVAKGSKTMCSNCGANTNSDHNFCVECGEKLGDAVKGHDFICLGCGRELDEDEKYCPGCGKQNPGYEGMNMKADKPVPGEGVVGSAASDIEPVPAHREPDGEAVEVFEADAGLPTDPDAAYLKAADRFKSAGAPYDLGVLHDLTCAAFHPESTISCHKGARLSDIDVSAWQNRALDAASSAPLDEASKMTQLWQHAVTIKSVDSDVLDEARHDAHKSFQDANPGSGSFPTPTELSPAKFKRPYISAGHAAASPGHFGPNSARVPGDHIAGSDFTRGPLDAGHAEDSPSNKGSMSRTYYRNTQRESARSAMQAMHDHIAQTFPDLCSMSGPGVGGEPPVGARPVPDGVGKSDDVDKATAKVKKAKGTKAAKHVDATVIDVELIKSAVIEATADLAKQVANISSALDEERKRTAALQRTVDALSELPDPTTAAFKGVAQQTSVAKMASGVPAGARTVAETAERTQLAMMNALQLEARNNPDPAQREAAWARLYQMTGLSG